MSLAYLVPAALALSVVVEVRGAVLIEMFHKLVVIDRDLFHSGSGGDETSTVPDSTVDARLSVLQAFRPPCVRFHSRRRRFPTVRFQVAGLSRLSTKI